MYGYDSFNSKSYSYKTVKTTDGNFISTNYNSNGKCEGSSDFTTNIKAGCTTEALSG
jgi:hypothetical protein